MIVVATLETVVLVVVVWLLLRRHSAQEAAWATERRELLTRIQRPDFVPLQTGEPFLTPEPEPDDIGLVGTITYADAEE